jgi:uridine phosphorylase
VRQKTLGESCKCVEEMKVSWEAWSCAIIRASKVEGEKSLTCAWLRGLGKCKVRASHSHEGLRASKGTGGWCVVC